MRCRSDGRRFALHPGGTCYPCPPTALVIPVPQRHLLSLPRGRGPSQTPKFLSPGPPSPWLPALSTRAAYQLTRHPWEPLTPAEPATSRVSPSPGNTAAGSVSAARVQPRGCKGRSPLHKKTLSLPLPAGKSALRARVGGMGAKTKLKAKSAGDNESTPPAGHPSGRDSQCRKGQAPMPPPGTGTPPSPPRKGQSPSPGNTAAGSVSAVRVQPRGMQGAKPLA